MAEAEDYISKPQAENQNDWPLATRHLREIAIAARSLCIENRLRTITFMRELHKEQKAAVEDIHKFFQENCESSEYKDESLAADMDELRVSTASMWINGSN